jgi:hypothetical protein
VTWCSLHESALAVIGSDHAHVIRAVYCRGAATGGSFGGAVVLALIPMRWLHHCPAEDPGPRVAAMAEVTPSRPLTPVERTMPPRGPAQVSTAAY